MEFQPPSPGIIKINCDASFYSITGNVGACAIARDCSGAIIAGDTSSFKAISASAAKAFALRVGVRLAIVAGFQEGWLGIAVWLQSNLQLRRMTPRRPIQLPWCCPKRDRTAVNCDGAVNPLDGTAAIGGVMRDWSDSLTAFEAIHSNDSGLEGSLLLHDVRDFLSRVWRVRIRYINRSGNMVADKLARMRRGKPIGEALSESPPVEVIPLLEKDMSLALS
ncbi:hypothetical protein V6N12_057704 [Hibiscus sabdariffa]|uniref:RNase H type-1 domain-containing protein n=1 Tax=Hibiscus sabdariffa TaxID=183260 RepID=A0ABR2C5W5_9ROSI